MWMCTNMCTETSWRMRDRYQDTICSEAEEGRGDRPWEVPYNYVVDPATSEPSKETSEAFPLTKKKKKTVPLAFLELMTVGKLISFGPYRQYFVCYNDLCHLASAVVGPMKQYTCVLKIVTRLPWECVQILIFWRSSHAPSLSVLLLRHYALLVWITIG